jgi:hypothetical protein
MGKRQGRSEEAVNHFNVRDLTFGGAGYFFGGSGCQQAIQQSLRLLLDHEDLGADLLQRAQRLQLIEVPREADLVADLGGIFLDLGIERVRPHLAAGEGLEAEIGTGLCLRCCLSFRRH